MDKKQKTLIEKNRARAQKLIRLYMDELSKPEKLETAPINQIASALGTLIEKFGKKEEEQSENTIIVTHNVPRAGEDEL